MDGILSDDMSSRGKVEIVVRKDAKPASALSKNKKINQIAQLITTLLGIGDLKSARHILSIYPTVHQTHLEIGEAMSRLVNVIIEPSYHKFCGKSFLPQVDTSNVKFASLRLPVNTANFRSCSIDDHITMGRKAFPPSYRFFYAPWKEDIVIPSDAHSILRLIRNLLYFVGTSIHKDLRLATKLARLGKFHVTEVFTATQDHLNDGLVSG